MKTFFLISASMFLSLGAFADTAYYCNGNYKKSGSTWYYPNGNYAQSGTTVYYPNGNYVKSGTTVYYPNGNYFKSGDTLYYSNGNYLKSGSTYYYTNGNYLKSGSTCYFENGNSMGSCPRLVVLDLGSDINVKINLADASVAEFTFQGQISDNPVTLSLDSDFEVSDIYYSCSSDSELTEFLQKYKSLSDDQKQIARQQICGS
jgi:hypothetical protein